MPLAFRTYSGSDIGLQRSGNEDAALVSPKLIAVADGMGGHAGGEVASSLAIHTLAAIPQAELAERFIDISSEIDSEISAKTKVDQALSGMGTTLTALHLTSAGIELLHIGDSRCYVFSDGKLQQLSTDHTVMQELLDQGRLSPEEVINHPQRSLLTQALMGDSGIDPEVMLYKAKLGDQFLLCSDGLTGVLSDLEILESIRSFDGQALVDKLIELVKAKGAPDNVTILWAEIVDVAVDGQIQFIGAAGEANE
jgi:serine/threonine protein phosphatase PrpC